MQMGPVVRSRRKARREAEAWLRARAQEMNDPHARQVLNSAAFAFSSEKLRGFDPETGRTKPPTSTANAPAISPSADKVDEGT